MRPIAMHKMQKYVKRIYVVGMMTGWRGFGTTTERVLTASERDHGLMTTKHGLLTMGPGLITKERWADDDGARTDDEIT